MRNFRITQELLFLDREGEDQTVVALFPGGSKADSDSQRTSPILFAQLKEQSVCPVRAFVQWLQFRDIKRYKFSHFK